MTGGSLGKVIMNVKKENNKKNKIIEAARILFNEKGYFETKVEDITKSLNISKGNFYTYFDTKEELLIDIMESSLIEYKKMLQTIDISNKRDKKEILRDFIYCEVKFIEETGSKYDYKIIDYLLMNERTSQYIFKKRKIECKFIGDVFVNEIKNDNLRDYLIFYIHNILAGYYLNYTINKKVNLFNSEIEKNRYLDKLTDFIYLAIIN